MKAQLGCYRPPAAFGRRRCRRPLAPGPGPTATRVGLWTAPRPGRPVGNPRVLLPNSSRSLRDRREGRKKQGHRLWQQDKRMTRPSCPLAAPHFAPASSTRFPPQCPCHVKPTARQARVAARDPIIVLHCEPPPLVPPPGSWISLFVRFSTRSYFPSRNPSFLLVISPRDHAFPPANPCPFVGPVPASLLP